MDISKLELNKEYTWREICELVGFKYSTDGRKQKRQLEELKESAEVVDNGKTRKAKRYIVKSFKSLFEQNLSNYTLIIDKDLYSLNGQNLLEKNKDKDKMTRSELEELEFSIMISNIHKLYDGRTYTYKQICKALELDEKTGNSKKARIKQIERLVALDHKKGGKFFVLKHYGVPLEKQDDRMDKIGGRTFGNMLLYALMVEYFGIDGIDEEYEVVKDNRCIDIVVTRNKMYELMDMVNGNYRRYKYNHKALAEETQTHEVIVDDYFVSTELQLKGYLTKALSNLKGRRLISSYNDCIMLVFKGHRRPATSNEEKLITLAEKKVLIDMDVDSIYHVIKQNRNEEFYKRVTNKLVKLSKDDEEYKIFKDIKSYYKAIKIGTMTDLLAIGYSEMVEDVIKAMAEANDLVLESIVKHYNKDDCKYADRLIQEVNEGIKFGRIREDDFFQELYVLNKVVIESNNFRYSPKRREAEKYLVTKDDDN